MPEQVNKPSAASSTVIPAKAGIKLHQRLMDSGSSLCYGRNDDSRSQVDLFSTLLEVHCQLLAIGAGSTVCGDVTPIDT